MVQLKAKFTRYALVAVPFSKLVILLRFVCLWNKTNGSVYAGLGRILSKNELLKKSSIDKAIDAIEEGILVKEEGMSCLLIWIGD